ncbi:DmpA family aminopeptidase [Sphingosinicella rhizophila]|uniref:P1 family peptidase n=1 Tax=Sphingosinicella rhizophila TaxID=3050082 RepID=A0ABU3Q949_9SPHN|nr:P1 family peptidase [Sphingosinicella sp. GR2756]MDT9599928.1 P1 family peptidase [Sphingosinicella sp. GR2756]
MTKRARDYGIPFSGTPGPLNAITDVPGVEVGYATIWEGAGKLEVGKGPVRTGVTAILPRGKADSAPCFGAWASLNHGGEMTGTIWLDERGLCEGPVLITNTHQVGVVRDAAITWMRRNAYDALYLLPIVAETYDGLLNDIDGGHIKPDHVFEALDSARDGPIAEGSVGGGTGMMCYEYKAGTGTASRVLPAEQGGYTVGVLVQTNYGERRSLRLGGIRLGERLADDRPRFADDALMPQGHDSQYARWVSGGKRPQTGKDAGDGSIIVIVVTDAPLLPHQLKRVAKRPGLGIGRLGGLGAALSGDIFLALSTANQEVSEAGNARPVQHFPNLNITAIFEAAIDATEEAIVNAMVAAEPTEGANGFFVPAIPIERVRAILAEHHLLETKE